MFLLILLQETEIMFFELLEELHVVASFRPKSAEIVIGLNRSDESTVMSLLKLPLVSKLIYTGEKCTLFTFQ